MPRLPATSGFRHAKQEPSAPMISVGGTFNAPSGRGGFRHGDGGSNPAARASAVLLPASRAILRSVSVLAPTRQQSSRKSLAMANDPIDAPALATSTLAASVTFGRPLAPCPAPQSSATAVRPVVLRGA